VGNEKSWCSIRASLVSAFAFVFSAALSPVQADTAWVSALKSGDVEELMWLVDGGGDVFTADASGKNAMMVAAKADHTALIDKLLSAGLNVNAQNHNGGTALMFAAVSGNISSVRLLVKHGALVNARARNGWTAMTLAAAKGHADVVSRLLEQGADPAIADIYGWTPLMRAVEQHRESVVRLLLESGRSSIDASNDLGASALHRAAAQGLGKIACLLLSHGADTRSTDDDKHTPAQTARLSGHPEIESLIERGTCDIVDRQAAPG